jgi:3',5'-cyclic AMP phosphodiesterase CpdA
MQRILLIATVLALVFTAAALAADDFTFVIMSDRTGGANQPMFEQAVAEITALHPDFVVTVGDLIEGYAGNDVRTKQWDEILKPMRRIGCPVYYTPGNHDIGDVESARLFFEKTDRPPYYSFDKGSSHFIVLNTALLESYDQVDPAQRRWLEQDLLLNQMKSHIFVFMHKTFWLGGAARDAATDPMHQLFKKYHVTAVFCGHGHS